MQDPLADMETRKLIDKTLAGKTAWSETTLGSTLDANAEAIQTMQRGAKLPECDWGLDDSQESSAQFTLFLRAHALAGLNTLEGMRRMAKGDSQRAVNTWHTGDSRIPRIHARRAGGGGRVPCAGKDPYRWLRTKEAHLR